MLTLEGQEKKYGGVPSTISENRTHIKVGPGDRRWVGEPAGQRVSLYTACLCQKGSVIVPIPPRSWVFGLLGMAPAGSWWFTHLPKLLPL